MNVSYDAFYQNSINASVPPNSRAATAPDKNFLNDISWNTGLNSK